MGARLVRGAIRMMALCGLVAGPLGLAFVAAGPVNAAGSVSPTTNADDGSNGSLRHILENLSDPNTTVVLPPGSGPYQLTQCGAGPLGDIDINDAVVIEGNGNTIQQTCQFRVLDSAFDLTLRNLTITGGRDDYGAGLQIDEGVNVKIQGVTFIGNDTLNPGDDDGGAINFDSSGITATITNSSFINNHAGDDGGAIDYNGCPTTVTIVGSTFSGNSTSQGNGNSGGAIDMEETDCSLTLVNSTVTGNTSGDDAAITGEYSGDSIKLVYTDVVNNTTVAPVGSGSASQPDRGPHGEVRPANDSFGPIATANVELHDPTLFTVFGTVIAEPHGGPNCSDATAVAMTGVVSHGFNYADDTSCDLTQSTDSQSATNNPDLGALADNGGPTETLLPQTGSPLIDAIPNASCQADGASGVTTDQRLLPRPDPASGLCDIGAVEVQPPAAAAVVVTPKFTG